jgi:acyl carrier protein
MESESSLKTPHTTPDAQDPNRIQPMSELELEIRSLIYKSLNLDIPEEDIQLETPFFDSAWGLGLDSLESLEIVTCISHAYGTSFEAAQKEDFSCVKSLAAFVNRQRTWSPE